VTTKNGIFWDVAPCGLYEPTFLRNVLPPSAGWKESVTSHTMVFFKGNSGQPQHRCRNWPILPDSTIIVSALQTKVCAMSQHNEREKYSGSLCFSTMSIICTIKSNKLVILNVTNHCQNPAVSTKRNLRHVSQNFADVKEEPNASIFRFQEYAERKQNSKV
jgi:hypothetical protein